MSGLAVIEAASAAADACRLVSQVESRRIRGIDYCIRRWGNPKARPLLMLHGARDCSATFQFVVDAFKRDWHIIAPDWRGHGHSGWAPQSYWVHDFLGDLDVLLDAVFPGIIPDIVGHSMGGNTAGLYVGLRPDRARRFVSLDGIGPPVHRLPVDMTATLDAWLRPTATTQSRGYDTLADVAGRLMKANYRLTPARAAFLAAHSAKQHDDGKWRWLFDPGMTRSLPTLHTLAEWAAIWARVTIPARWIGSSDLRSDAPSFNSATVEARRKLLPHAVYTRLENTGHNVHHDRPEDVAALIESFLLGDVP